MTIFSYLRSHAVISTVIVLLAIIISVIAGRASSQKAPVLNTSDVKHVSLVNAATFRQGNAVISANGIVESRSQAELKSQVSAPISAVNVSVGQTVSAGQVLLELQNADIRAQLSQAEASLTLAKGQFSTGAVSLDSAKQGAIDKIRDSYIKVYDAMISNADSVLYNNNGNGGQLVTFSFDNKLNWEMTSTQDDLKRGFLDWKTQNDALSKSSDMDSIEAAIKISKTHLAQADTVLNDISKILNDLSSSATQEFAVTVNNWKSVIGSAHASVTSAEQALSVAVATLDSSTSSQGATAPAQVSVAEAGVNNLKAQLAKTIVKSPIAGKVSVLPLREGELASPGTLLATIIGNDSGLLVKAYVSGEDLSRIRVGGQAVIVGTSAKGVVSNMAPGVDTATKKAEVDIDIADAGHSGLVIGENVSAQITSLPVAAATNAASQSVVYLLPIQDVKIVPGQAYVFTVNQDSKIARNDVTLGEIQGDFIEVTSGLTDAMDIITPVYELDEGESVKVQ